MDGPPAKPKRLTVGELLATLALNQRGIAASKLDIAGLHGSSALRALKLDLAGLGLAGAEIARKLTIGDALASYWRGQLTDASAKTQGVVAGQMSQVIAGLRVPSVGLAGLDTDFLTKGFGDAFGEGIAALTRNLGAGLAASIKPLALLTSRALTEAMRAADERERLWLDALYAMGWWMPQSAFPEFAYRVGKLAYEGDKLGVRHEMNEATHSREFVRVVSKDWMRLSVFRERKRFFLDALADHRRGRYRVSIPTLLPHLEGIAMAAFAPAQKDPRMMKVVKEAAAYDTLLGDALLTTVTTLWDSEGFIQLSPTDRRLNRPRILHGRSTGYGTAVNSTKLLLTFDLLASLVEEKERQKRQP